MRQAGRGWKPAHELVCANKHTFQVPPQGLVWRPRHTIRKLQQQIGFWKPLGTRGFRELVGYPKKFAYGLKTGKREGVSNGKQCGHESAWDSAAGPQSLQ